MVFTKLKIIVLPLMEKVFFQLEQDEERNAPVILVRGTGGCEYDKE